MAEHTTAEKLAALAACVDQAAEDRGWNHGHLLVRVEDSSGEEFDYGLKELDDHPLEYLLGFTAPPTWSALGVCCEGWAAPMGTGQRPSRSKGRIRVRTTALASRDGVLVSGVRRAGEEYEAMPDVPVGMVPDALRRALGVPTPPPEAPFTTWLASSLLTLLIGDGGCHRQVAWSQVRPRFEAYEELGRIGGWEITRSLTAKGHAVVTSDLSPEVAAWMDEGMFARWALSEVAPYELLLDQTRATTTPEAFTQIRRLLRSWGLRTFRRRAA